jgi:hypothetical protein
MVVGPRGDGIGLENDPILGSGYKNDERKESRWKE